MSSISWLISLKCMKSKHAPMGYPNPIAAIEFRMEQAGLRPADLVSFIGSRAKVSEVLSGKRAITMRMARALHGHLGIPAAVLLQEPNVDLDDPLSDIEWSRFPVKSMAKLGWIPDGPDLAGCAEHAMRELIDRAGRTGCRGCRALPEERPCARECQNGPLCAQGVVLADPCKSHRSPSEGRL